MPFLYWAEEFERNHSLMQWCHSLALIFKDRAKLLSRNNSWEVASRKNQERSCLVFHLPHWHSSTQSWRRSSSQEVSLRWPELLLLLHLYKWHAESCHFRREKKQHLPNFQLSVFFLHWVKMWYFYLLHRAITNGINSSLMKMSYQSFFLFYIMILELLACLTWLPEVILSIK